MKLSTGKMMLNVVAVQSNSKQLLLLLNSRIIAAGGTIY